MHGSGSVEEVESKTRSSKCMLYASAALTPLGVVVAAASGGEMDMVGALEGGD